MRERRHQPPPTKYAPPVATPKAAAKPAVPPRAPHHPPPPIAGARLGPVQRKPAAPEIPRPGVPPAVPARRVPGGGAVAAQPATGPGRSPPPLQRAAVAPAAPGATAVVQLWQNYIPGWVRGSIAVAAGAAAGTAAFVYTPSWSMRDRVTAAATTGLATAAVTNWALTPTDYARGFSAQINNQGAFYADIDQRLNTGTNFTGATNTLDVPGASLRDAADRLRARERTQRELAGAAYAWGRDIFDATIPNHVQKNTLWRQWMALAGAGQTAAGGAVDRGFRDRVATTLARMIATGPGYTLMNQVRTEAAALNVPIRFREEAGGAAFNLTVAPAFNPAGTALTGLDVTVPAAGEYDDAQSFKRSNRRLMGGGHDVTQVGEHLTASPIDVELFHEFVHAAHYLAMERQRQAGGGTFVTDVAHYNEPIGGPQEPLWLQDDVGEAATIHRSNSLMNLHQLVATNAGAHVGLGPNPHTPMATSIARIDQIATGSNIPAENDYRVAIGLAPRQDHRALRRQGGTYANTGAALTINVT